MLLDSRASTFSALATPDRNAAIKKIVIYARDFERFCWRILRSPTRSAKLANHWLDLNRVIAGF